MKKLFLTLTITLFLTSSVFAQEKKANIALCLTLTLAVSALAQDSDVVPPAEILPAAAYAAKEEAAYAIGVQAYIWGHPLVEMYRQGEARTSSPNPSGTNAPINEFGHARKLVDSNWKSGLYPNSDTLYSLAWLDLAREPLVLSVPDTKGRYYVVQLVSAYNEVVASLGSRTKGYGEASYLLAGPHWKGDVPEGIEVVRSTTNLIWMLNRTLISGPEEYEAVHAVQDGYTLQSLSDFVAGKPAQLPSGFPAGTPASKVKPFPDGIAFFKELDRILQTEGILEKDQGLMNFFALVGLGPDVDFETKSQDPATRAGLLRAVASADRMLKERAVRLGVNVNGWQAIYTVGRYDDYGQRGALSWMGGAGANLPEDALYPMAFVDSEGRPLHGANHYVIRFEKGQTPPVQGFWSLSMYGAVDQNPVANELNRYNIGDRTEGLKYGDDGSLTIYLQADRPAEDTVSNWLPAPKGAFMLAMRAYWPEEPILNKSYQWPPVIRE